MEHKRKFRLNISKKVRRIILNTLIILVGSYVLLLVGLSIYVSSSKEKLISFLDSELKETIPGELKIDKTEITVWETFPRIGIVLDNVTISDSVYRKPFLKAETITAKVGFLGLAGHKLRINSVKIEDAILFAFTHAKGYSN